jgi:hypothetical protein
MLRENKGRENECHVEHTEVSVIQIALECQEYSQEPENERGEVLVYIVLKIGNKVVISPVLAELEFAKIFEFLLLLEV